ncbi:hemicentin-1 isoform X4 [Hydra vulgaris]
MHLNVFDAVLVYIATWFDVRGWGANERATFQVAIITDGIRSFVRFSYHEMLLQNLLKNVQVGYKLDDSNDCEVSLNISINGYESYTYPLDKIKGNTGENGVWMFEITKDKFPITDLKSITVTVLALGNLHVKTGERVILFCHISKNSNVSYLWYKDGLILEMEGKSMFVKDFSMDDAGVYQCKISNFNDVQTSINSVTISVIFSEVPTLTILPYSSSAVNASVVLSCDIKSYPRPVISWHKDEVFLKEGTVSVLVIPAATLSHAGSYRCIASSVNGRIASKAQYLEIKPLLQKIMHKSFDINEANVTLTCTPSIDMVKLLLLWNRQISTNSSSPVVYFANANIKSVYYPDHVCNTLHKNQQDISIFLQMLEEASVALFKKSNISYPVLNDIQNVNFSCPKQPFRSISYEWNITFYGVYIWESVKYIVKSSSFKDSNSSKCTASFSDGDNKIESVDIPIKYIDPPFIESSQNLSLLIDGIQLILNCNAESSQVLLYQWSKDGDIINNQSNLYFESINKTTSGSYTCHVNNGNLKASTSVFLDVHYISTPHLLLSSNQTVSEGETIYMFCEVDGMQPISTIWLKNGQYLNDTSDKIFLKVKRSDSGSYKCIVKNKAGEKSSNELYLDIMYLEQPSIKSSQNISVLTVGSQLLLICEALGNPTVGYKWLKNDEVVSNTKELHFERVNENTKGSYTCDVSNGFTTKSSVVYLGAQYIKTPRLRFSNFETVIEEDFLSMFCEVDSTSPVYFKWWKNGKLLDHELSVLVLKVKRNDSGLYKCQAQNNAGSKVSNEQFLNVMYMDRPVINRLQGAKSNIEGDSLLMSCSADANPSRSNLSFSWKLNGRLILHGAFLSISNATKKDSGIYECSVKNSVGVSKEEFINIQYLDEPSLILLQDSIVLEGSSLTLHCLSAGSFPLSYFWIKNNTLINYTNEHLIFKAITRLDQGMYQCKVSNNVSSKFSAAVNIQVVYLDEPVIAMSKDLNSLFEGAQLLLSCNTVGSMNISYQWFKNNDLISNNKELFFQNFTNNDTGSYRCYVTNGYMKKFNVVFLAAHFTSVPWLEFLPYYSIVEGTPLIILCHVNSSDHVKYFWYKDGKKLPDLSKSLYMVTSRNSSGVYACVTSTKYSTKMSNSQYLEIFYLSFPFINERQIVLGKNQSTNISCLSNSFPVSNYTWMKDGQVIAHDQVLLINDMNLNSVGVYECYVENIAGRKMTSTNVQLQFLEKPKISTLPSKKILEGNSLFLICETTGSGKISFFWSVDGIVFDQDTPYKLIEHLNRYDKKTVFCIAKNNHDSKMSDVLKLDIIYLDKPVIKMFETLDYLTLNCSSNGNPPPSIAWYYHGIFITDQTVLEVAKSSVTEYECVAKNEFGEKSVSTVFEKQSTSKPVLKINPSIFPKEGDSVVMTCETNGENKFEWFKDTLILVGNSQMLFFKAVKRTDSGRYQCKVLDDHELISQAVQLVVSYLDEPIIELLHPLPFIMVGDNIELKCVSSAKVIFTWRHNSIILSNSSILSLQIVTTKSQGEYICEIYGEMESRKASKVIHIHYMYRPIVQFLPSNSIVERNTAIAICNENSSDSVNYTWFKNNEVLPESSRFFTIVYTNRTDNGLYKCKTSNQYTERFSNDYLLNVEYLDKPVITESEILGLVTFNCTADGNPAPNYTWFYKNSALSNETQLVVNANIGENEIYVCQVSNKVKSHSVSTAIIEPAMNVPVLNIMPFDRIEEGSTAVLTCEVERLGPINYLWYKNGILIAGTSATKFFINAMRNDTGTYQCTAFKNQSMKSSNNITMKVEYLDKPVIIVTHPNKKICVNDYVQVICSSSGSSAITYQWKYGNKVLSNFSVLEFESINKENHGEYSCEVFSVLGMKKQSFKVIMVHYLDEPFLDVSPSNNVKEGSSLTLRCSVNSSEPVFYTWIKNDLDMEVHSEFFVISKVNHHSDHGVYYCTASNIAGFKTSNELTILVSYLKTPMITDVQKDGFIFFTCFAEGYPSPQYIWKLYEKNLTHNDTLQIEISKSYSNEYECTAFNEYHTKSVFSVGLKMSLSTPLLKVFPSGNINRGSSVFFTCSMNSNKPVTYAWYKNKKVLVDQFDQVLHLENVNINDSGEYKCTISNDIEMETSKSKKLDVLYLNTPDIGKSMVILNETENFSLPCRCFGNPSDIEYRWVKGVEENIISNTSTLVLKDVQTGDSSIYKCVCKNIVAETFQIVKIIVNYLGPTSVFTTSSNMSKEGDSITMHCLSNGTAPLAYRWKKNNIDIKHNDNVFSLHNVTHSDSGLYSCEVFNPVGSQNSNAVNLSVSFLTNPIVISMNGDSILKEKYNESDTVKLACISSGYPAVFFKWNNKNKMVSFMNEIVIQSVAIDDASTFECQVTNGIETKSTFYELKVVYINQPHLSLTPSLSVEENRSAVLNCSVNGSQPIKYTWYKDNLPIYGYSTTIVFYGVKRSDHGVYTCHANNLAGTKISNAVLLMVTYLEEPTIFKEEILTDDQYLVLLKCSVISYPQALIVWFEQGLLLAEGPQLNLSSHKMVEMEAITCHASIGELTKKVTEVIQFYYFSTPFIQVIPEGNINRGSTVILTCSFDGLTLFNSLTYSWYKDNKEIFGYSQKTLLFENIEIENGGEYKCTVANNETMKTSSLRKLTVYYIKPPVLGLSTITLKEGQNFSLPCKCDGNPDDINYRWVKGVEEMLSSNTSMLVLNNVLVQDTGIYKCICKNLAMEAFQHVQIFVNYLGPASIYTSSSNMSKEGDSITLYCFSNGTAPLTYKWKKNNADIKQYSNVATLYNVHHNDSGLYSCEVINSVGSQNSNIINISVSYLEEPTISEDEIVTGNHHFIYLKCSVLSYPPASISWLLDDLVIEGSFINRSNEKMIASEKVVCQASNGVQTKRKEEVIYFYYLAYPNLFLRYKTDYSEGDNIELVCETNGSMPIIYTWFQNGITLSAKSNVLYLKNVSRNETGIYECLVQNQLMQKASLQEVVKISYLDQPSIKISTDFMVFEGDDVLLECLVSGYPYPSVQWYKDGELLYNESRLYLSKIQRQQGGLFVCTIYNRVGKKSSFLLLKVHYMDTPTLSINGSLTIASGSSLIIKCLVISSSPLQVSYLWYKDGYLLPNTSNESEELALRYIEQENSGLYSCSSKFVTFVKSSEDNLTLTVKQGFLPQCNNNWLLVYQNNNWECICKDGFYGDNCEQNNQVVQAKVSIMSVCNQTVCYSGTSLRDQLSSNHFYIFLKQSFEEQMLSSFRAELQEDYVVQVKWINHNFEEWLNIDYLVYFTNSLHKSVSQQQKLVQMVAVKYFYNRVHTKNIFSFQIIAKLTRLKDFDYCYNSTTLCDTHAECLNGLGTHFCRCRSGYAGDGIKCDPILSCDYDGQKKLLIFGCIILSTILLALCIGYILARILIERRKKLLSSAHGSVSSYVDDNNKGCIASVLPEVKAYSEALEFYKKLER